MSDLLPPHDYDDACICPTCLRIWEQLKSEEEARLIGACEKHEWSWLGNGVTPTRACLHCPKREDVPDVNTEELRILLDMPEGTTVAECKEAIRRKLRTIELLRTDVAIYKRQVESERSSCLTDVKRVLAAWASGGRQRLYTRDASRVSLTKALAAAFPDHWKP